MTASAESPRFRRGDELAWSTVWVLDSPAAAGGAFESLGDSDFARCFVEAVVAGLDPSLVAGVTELHRSTVAGGWVVHRARIGGGDATGFGQVHLALLGGVGGRAATLVVLAASTAPPTDSDLTVVATRVGRRFLSETAGERGRD